MIARRSSVTQYRDWMDTSIDEYKGLTPADRAWLEKFNDELIDRVFKDEGLHLGDRRKELSRLDYKQRYDAMNWLNPSASRLLSEHGIDPRELGLMNRHSDPESALVRLRDHQRKLKRRKKVASDRI